MMEAIGFGIVVPGCVAATVTWLALRLSPRGSTGRCLASAGPACGFLAGYALAVDGEWLPERNWHWLPYLALAAAAAGAVAAIRRPLTEQPPDAGRVPGFFIPVLFPVLCLMLAVASAAALVPKWTDRTIQVPGLAGLLFLLLMLFDALPRRVVAGRLLPLMYLSAFATAAFVAAKVSLTYAQLAGVAAAAFAGASLVVRLRGETASLPGLFPTYILLLEGAAYVGCIYPDEPIYGLLIPPAAPLALWAFSRAPLARLEGRRRVVCEYVSVLLVLFGAAALLFAGSSGESGSEW